MKLSTVLVWLLCIMGATTASASTMRGLQSQIERPNTNENRRTISEAEPESKRSDRSQENQLFLYGRNDAPALLGTCEGPCVIDLDCTTGHLCFEKDSFAWVPGCEGGEMDSATGHYCVEECELINCEDSALPAFEHYTANNANFEVPAFFNAGTEDPSLVTYGENDRPNLLRHCEGNCEATTDCFPGHICYKRYFAREAVPGCQGGEQDDTDNNFCVDRCSLIHCSTPSPVATVPASPPMAITAQPNEAPMNSSASQYPSQSPTDSPSTSPTATKNVAPPEIPTDDSPSSKPSVVPTVPPSSFPTDNPTGNPTPNPTNLQSSAPSSSAKPSGTTKRPTSSPSTGPTDMPSFKLTESSTDPPSFAPIPSPSTSPTQITSSTPSASPSTAPIRSRLLPYVLGGGSEFNDMESYQSKALARTEQQLGIHSMLDTKIVQYYALY